MVLLADLAVGAVAVALAVHALPAAPRLLVQLLVEPAPVRPPVALARCKFVMSDLPMLQFPSRRSLSRKTTAI